MFSRIFFFLFGFGMMVIGSSFLILYLNFFTIGYSFLDYVKFIIRRPETYYLIIGFIILSLTIILPGGKNYGFYLWYFS